MSASADPVFDPELPPEVGAAYEECPEAFTPARQLRPMKMSDWEVNSTEAAGTMLVIGGAVVGLWLLLRWFFELVFPNTVATALNVITGVLGGLVIIGMLWVSSEESEERALARKYHRRYLLAEDFDEEATALMVRAQDAVKAVRDAKVAKEGLLDDIKHDVVLPAQLWELGLLLHRSSVLRAKHHRILDRTNHPALDSLLHPQREVLRRSTEAATRKVESLERLAERVRTADAALRAQEMMPAVQDDDERYLDLLATVDIAGDTSEIDELEDDAAKITELLNRSIENVRTTSRELTAD